MINDLFQLIHHKRKIRQSVWKIVRKGLNTLAEKEKLQLFWYQRILIIIHQ